MLSAQIFGQRATEKSSGKIVKLNIHTHLRYGLDQPSDLLLQIHAAAIDGQNMHKESFDVRSGTITANVDGEEGIGERIWLKAEGEFECIYEAEVELGPVAAELNQRKQTSLCELPSEITKYLMPSRYCDPDSFLSFTAQEFGVLSGGELVAAMSDWIESNFSYDSGASNSQTTATDSFSLKAGVCRDYAHVLIAMARGFGIPARIVSAYALNVTPQDFHALVEVYLDGAWHLVDPTGMTNAESTVIIGVGRDAADVSFLTSFGFVEMKYQSVRVTPLQEK